MTGDERQDRPADTLPIRHDQPAGPVGPTEPVQSQEPPGPLIEAAGLGRHHRRHWVFHDVDLVLRPGGVAAVVGAAGTGRSSLLLTLSGRMRHSAGELRVAGCNLPRRARRVRRRAGVARIGGAVDLEGRLTVRETLIERESLDAVPAERAEAVFDDACDLLGLRANPYARVEELPRVDRTRLALAMALLAEPMFVVLDDVDSCLQAYEQRDVWQRIQAIAESGVAVVAATADPTPAYGLVDVAVPLRGGEGEQS